MVPEMERGLNLILSNRLEALAEGLAAAVRQPRADPRSPDAVVVQSRGMARWIQLELARRNGVCALMEFPFPKALVHTICAAVVPEAVDTARYDRDALTWRTWSVFASRQVRSEYEEAANYAGGDPRRWFQLSVRVAGLLDQYLVYRPDLIAAWEAGKTGTPLPCETWQAQLWRTMRGGAEQGAWTESRRLATAIERLNAGPGGWTRPDGTFPKLPERIALFGIAVLPPVYLELFAALARHTDVTLYSLQPSQEYWADMVSRREAQKHLSRAGQDAEAGPALHLERGPRLLMSLGKMGRGFLGQLAEKGAGGGDDPFADPGEDSLLHRVQSDLLHLRDRLVSVADVSMREMGMGMVAGMTLDPADPSLRVHVCHSPRRELEVLQDQVLDAMEADPSLTPRDILVLTPDIESYAPLIHAVFGAPEDERLSLPYTIADRVPRAESSLADAFLRILTLPERRCGRTEIEPLLEVSALQRRFGLTPEGVVRIRGWLEDLGTSWGIDATQRGALKLPSLPQGTWRHGADRLLLGAAMASGDEALVGGTSPLDGIEGDGALMAGGFAAFVAALESLAPLREKELSLTDWATELNRVMDAFFESEDGEDSDERLVRVSLTQLKTVANAAAFAGPVRLIVVREQLELWLSEERSAGGFLRGGVTFAALKPMRSIPARIIAAIGLNDTAFPRQPTTQAFDLIGAKHRPGDEARQEDDRHLFLETLLSARDRLHLSHVGQSIRDNAPLPPSVVISEVLDHLADITVGGSEAVEKAVVVRHPLHAFSTDYFGERSDPRLFSYSAENRRAAVSVWEGPGAAEPVFLSAPLVAPAGAGAVVGVVELDALRQFLRNPSKFFLQERLGVRLPRTVAIAADRERFDLGGREKFALKQTWLERMREGGSVDELSTRAQADGDLPLGPAGAIATLDVTGHLATLLAAIPPGQRRGQPAVPVAVPLGSWTLQGTVEGLTDDGLLFVKPARFKASDLLDLWVRLLVLVARKGSSPDLTARLLAQDSKGVVEQRQLSAPQDPAKHLAVLLDAMAKGRGQPLPLFPRSAAAFTQPVGSKVKSTPLARAVAEWEGTESNPGECLDPAFALCFGRVVPHPLDDAFAELAQVVMGPMWEHASKGEE